MTFLSVCSVVSACMFSRRVYVCACASLSARKCIDFNCSMCPCARIQILFTLRARDDTVFDGGAWSGRRVEVIASATNTAWVPVSIPNFGASLLESRVVESLLLSSQL